MTGLLLRGWLDEWRAELRHVRREAARERYSLLAKLVQEAEG